MPLMTTRTISIPWNKPTLVMNRVIDMKIERAFMFKGIRMTTLGAVLNSILRGWMRKT